MINENEVIKKLSVINIDDGKNIFNCGDSYHIPLYQRDYAWEEKELQQLIEDLADIDESGSSYYLGSLIVSKIDDNKFEVIDGQQRLTSLYLLLNCLSKLYQSYWQICSSSLRFECREKSNDTLEKISELIEVIISRRNKNDENEDVVFEDSLKTGVEILIGLLTEIINDKNETNEDKMDANVFFQKLSKVVLFRIEVPPHTDLNKYFEIMNTRGEQLEQHHILKANLMGYLDSCEDSVFAKIAFAKIWDACSDMTGYVQMHFDTKDREFLFGKNWDMTSFDFDSFVGEIKRIEEKKAEEDKKNGKTTKGSQETKINNIVSPDFSVEKYDGKVEEEGDDIRVRFESIIEFPYFLMHTLKAYFSIKYPDEYDINEKSDKIIPRLIDDKKLCDNFKEAIKNVRDESDKERFVKDYIIYLLKARCLFDKYIIKREYKNDDENGEWSLKSLYQQKDKKDYRKPYYSNTSFTTYREHKQNEKSRKRNTNNIMIQSALRVSYTSPKSMHWITQLLLWLLNNSNSFNCELFLQESENIAKKAVNDSIPTKDSDEIYQLGVDTPHIVFNYLDYLLWKGNQREYKDFVFEFRNSVEHWYPQHPSKEMYESWEDDTVGNSVDRFGNLCLLQRVKNAQFSNLDPLSKKNSFEKTIKKGSLKLRIMSEETRDSSSWKEKYCAVHEKKMMDLLYANI